MTTRHQKHWTIAIVALSFCFTTCRKDISVPSTDLDKLFGTWNWIQSSGGFAGQINSPATSGYSQTIEFNKNGIYKIYKDGKQKDKMKFTLTNGTSIYNTGTAYLIKYKDIGLFDKNDHSVTQSVKFGGQDTLFLNDECYDCYGHIYIRQK
jgi:hypothetical protein